MSQLSPPPSAPHGNLLVPGLLRQKQQHARWFHSLCILAAGFLLSLLLLLALNFSWKPPLHWIPLLRSWTLLMFSTLALGLFLHWRRRFSIDQIARRLDGHLHSKNRLEASAELIASSSPLAQAQLEETKTYLHRELPEVREKKNPITALVAGVLLLAFLNVALLLLWSAGSLADWYNTPDPAAPTAEITWIKPKSEIKATPIEEVPLQAFAVSTQGMKDAVLEISVNGEVKKQLPVPDGALRQSGRQEISISLFLDELELVPYDVVSYHLRARRISIKPLPETFSPIQFIQIRPFRDDAAISKGGNGSSALPLITLLKHAQLRALKENFLLAHGGLAQDDPVRREENTRVGQDQQLLEKKTKEVITLLTQKGAPAEIINLLAQASELMPPAADKILKDQNGQALPGQGKSLALITEVEKFFTKIMGEGKGSPPKINASDPFKDQQKFEMPKREDTPAGLLEMLVQEQERIVKDLHQGENAASDPSSKPSRPESGNNPGPPSNAGAPSPAPEQPAKPSGFQGSPSERQTQISQAIGSLLNGKKLPEAVQPHLEKARTHAKKALQNLDASDPAGAREPAAATAVELKKALDLTNQQGEKESRQQLDEAQQELNDAAQDLKNPAPSPGKGDKAAQQTEAVEKRLKEAALAQQEAGSAKAAQALKDMAQSIQDSKVREDLNNLKAEPGNQELAQNAGDKLEALARAAAGKGRAPGPASAEDLQQAMGKLESNRNTLRQLARIDSKKTPASKGPGSAPDSPLGATPEQKGSGSEPGDGPESPSPSSSGEKGTQGNGPASSAESRSAQKTDDTREMTQETLKNLLENLQQIEALAETLPSNPEKEKALEASNNARNEIKKKIADSYAPVAKTVLLLEKPLEALNQWLNQQLGLQPRRHLLGTPDVTKAPPAYREAVSDYFEELSRDYQKDGSPSP